MKLVINMNELTIWKQDAYNKLNESKKICHEANESIIKITDNLMDNEYKIPKLKFLIKSIKQQLSLFKIIKENIELNIKLILVKRDKKLIKIEDEINLFKNLITELKNIKINESFIIDNENDNDRKNLFDFINSLNVDTLLLNIDNSINLINSTLDSKTIDSILIKLINEFNYLFNEWESIENFKIDNNSNHINDLINLNDELSLEMVEILKKLNDHYDNCINYESNNHSILKKKFNELPNLINLLKKNCNLIISNCNDIEKFLNIFNNFHSKITIFLNEVNEFNNLFLINKINNNFLNLQLIISNEFKKLNNFRVEIKQYEDDFKNFSQSYFELITEIKRRYEINYKIEKLINDFKIKLNDLKNDDLIKRNNFMNLNADFLPQDLIDFNIINNSTPNVDVSFNFEKLPKLK